MTPEAIFAKRSTGEIFTERTLMSLLDDQETRVCGLKLPFRRSNLVTSLSQASSWIRDSEYQRLYYAQVYWASDIRK